MKAMILATTLVFGGVPDEFVTDEPQNIPEKETSPEDMKNTMSQIQELLKMMELQKARQRKPWHGKSDETKRIENYLEDLFKSDLFNAEHGTTGFHPNPDRKQPVFYDVPPTGKSSNATCCDHDHHEMPHSHKDDENATCCDHEHHHDNDGKAHEHTSHAGSFRGDHDHHFHEKQDDGTCNGSCELSQDRVDDATLVHGDSGKNCTMSQDQVEDLDTTYRDHEGNAHKRPGAIDDGDDHDEL